MRIFIGEIDRNGRLGIEMLIDNEPGFQVVGIAVQAEGLVNQVRACQPDIVLLDWRLVRLSPVSVFKEIHALESQPQIIIMDVHVGTRQIAIACGADAFLGKDAPGDQLLPTLQRFK